MKKSLRIWVMVLDKIALAQICPAAYSSCYSLYLWCSFHLLDWLSVTLLFYLNRMIWIIIPAESTITLDIHIFISLLLRHWERMYASLPVQMLTLNQSVALRIPYAQMEHSSKMLQLDSLSIRLLQSLRRSASLWTRNTSLKLWLQLTSIPSKRLLPTWETPGWSAQVRFSSLSLSGKFTKGFDAIVQFGLCPSFSPLFVLTFFHFSLFIDLSSCTWFD